MAQAPDVAMGIFVLLPLMALVGLAVLAFVVALVMKGRAAAGVMVAIASCIGVALLMLLFVRLSFVPTSSAYTSTVDIGPMHVEHVGPPMPPGSPPTWFRLLTTIKLFVLIGIPLLIGVVVWAARKPACDGGRRGKLWPALFLIPLFGFFFFVFFFGSVRYSTQNNHAFNITPPPMPTDVMEQSAKMNAEMQRHAATVQAKMQREAAKMNAEMGRQFASADIHQLMDRVDEPRIALSSEAKVVAASQSSSEEREEASSPDAEAAEQEPAAVAEETSSEDIADEAESESTEAPVSQDEEDGTVREQSEEAEASDKSGESKEDEAAPVEKVAAAASTDDKRGEDTGKEAAPAATVAGKATDEKHANADASNGVNEEFDKELNRLETTNAPRPEWVSQPPQKADDNSWQEVIVTDEYATESECRRATDILLLLKTYERARSLASYPIVDASLPSLTFNNGMIMADGHVIYDRNRPEQWIDSRLHFLNRVGIGIDFVRRELITDQYLDEVERSFGPMYKLYTKIKFSPQADAALRQHWAAHERQERFAMVGAGAGSILGLLGFVYGLLKVDTLTKGYYTKRLFLGVPAAIIGGLLLLSFLV